jgi:hypothetical protein
MHVRPFGISLLQNRHAVCSNAKVTTAKWRKRKKANPNADLVLKAPDGQQ